MHEHKYSLTELENMIPWEREIYLSLLENHIREEEDKNKNKDKNKNYSVGAQNLLKAVPNREAYNKLSDMDKKGFDKAAKRAGLPMQKTK